MAGSAGGGGAVPTPTFNLNICDSFSTFKVPAIVVLPLVEETVNLSVAISKSPSTPVAPVTSIPLLNEPIPVTSIPLLNEPIPVTSIPLLNVPIPVTSIPLLNEPIPVSYTHLTLPTT